MTTVQTPHTLTPLYPAAVIARNYGFFHSSARKGRMTRIGSPPW